MKTEGKVKIIHKIRSPNGIDLYPTDLVLGLSSQDKTRSLFVTTKEAWLIPFKSIAKGKVIEIQNIDTLIKRRRLN